MKESPKEVCYRMQKVQLELVRVQLGLVEPKRESSPAKIELSSFFDVWRSILGRRSAGHVLGPNIKIRFRTKGVDGQPPSQQPMPVTCEVWSKAAKWNHAYRGPRSSPQKLWILGFSLTFPCHRNFEGPCAIKSRFRQWNRHFRHFLNSGLFMTTGFKSLPWGQALTGDIDPLKCFVRDFVHAFCCQRCLQHHNISIAVIFGWFPEFGHIQYFAQLAGFQLGSFSGERICPSFSALREKNWRFQVFCRRRLVPMSIAGSVPDTDHYSSQCLSTLCLAFLKLWLWLIYWNYLCSFLMGLWLPKCWKIQLWSSSSLHQSWMGDPYPHQAPLANTFWLPRVPIKWPWA